MGEKKVKNNHWFNCVNCGYHASEEQLRELLYVTDIKTKEGIVSVECPRCEIQQLVEK